MLLANRLKKGDTIGIVSSSNPISSLEDEGFNKGLENLRKQGFNVVVGKNICSQVPKERASDINLFFEDKTIDAIFSSEGGDTTQDTLPFVDFDIIKNNPKIFVGFSDNTVYNNAIYAKTGLIAFQGNDVRQGFGLQLSDYGVSEFEVRLIRGELGEIPANGERKTIVEGVAEGTLLGGNLRCLLKLKNTDMFPDFQNAILMLEAYHLSPEKCRILFSELDALKVFDKISGVIIGHVFGMQIEHPEDEQMEEIILEFVKDKPILKCEDFGHKTPNATLPVGAKVRMDATNKKLEIVEDFLK
jgi:muramoyltetrapeptide carboxypeptidase